MRVIDLKTMQSCAINEKTVVALGTFDGCHLGHASVFREAFLLAKRIGAKSVVYTFDTLTKKGAKSILTLDEKIKFIRKSQIDYVVIEDFETVKEKSGEDFVKDVLCTELKAACACCGFNYRFGKNASCNARKLSELFEKAGGSVLICEEVKHNDQLVSSTLVRSLIENGRVEEILPFSPPYSVYAGVIQGKMLGRTIGIPTINQELPKEKVVPKKGVYITECEIGEDVYPAITNVGTRPTVENDGVENIETHIIGYDGVLYGSYVRVNFYKRIRDEQKFSSIEELKAQIESDISQAKEYFK